MLTIKKRGACAGLICLAFLLFLAGCTPAGPRALLDGKRLLDEAKYPEAVEKLKTATLLLSTNALAWNYLGLAYQLTGQAADAETSYIRALTLDRDLMEARYNLGCLYLEQNKPEPAKAQFTAFILRRGNTPEALLKLASAQLKLRDLSGAERSYSEVLRLSAQNAEAYNGLGLARMQRNRVGDALQFFAAAVKVEPGYGPALLNLAIVKQQYLRDKQGALQAYKEYLSTKPPRAAEVMATVKQLEQELAPAATSPAVTQAKPLPTAPATNPPTAVSPVVTRPQTAQNEPTQPKPQTKVSPPATQRQAQTSPKTDAAPANSRSVSRAPVTKAPQPATPSQPATSNVEVVKLGAEPVIKPAQDISTPEPARAEPRASAPKQKSSPVALDSTRAAKPQKKGFLKSINPLNLLHSQENASKPAPKSYAAATTLPERTSADDKPEPSTSSARYKYKNPAKPAAGNRAKAESAFNRGLQAQGERRYSEAVESYRLAIQADPSFFEAQYNLSLALIRMGNSAAALNSYEEALAIQPGSADARYNFAMALKQGGYILDSASELQKMLAMNPNDVRGNLALANLYAQELRQPSKARQYYTKVLEVDPRHPQANAIRYWLTSNP